MKTISLDGHTYNVFFRYLSKFGKLPHFRKKAPFQAITICTIQSDDGKFTAQDLAVCSEHVAPKPTPAMREVLHDLKAIALLFQDLSIGPEITPEMVNVLTTIQKQISIDIECAEAELHPDQYSRREGRLRSLAKTLDRCGRLRKVKMEFLEAYLALDPRPLPPERTNLSDNRKEELIAGGAAKYEERAPKRLERERLGLPPHNSGRRMKKGLAAASPAGSEKRERSGGGSR